MINLSENQVKILKTIKEKVDVQGYPPSVREICCVTGIKSTSTVHSNMNKLEKLGFIKRDHTKPRAIEILNYIEKGKEELDKAIVELPVIEILNNGLGFEENIIEKIKLPAEFVIGRDNFIIKSKNNKMIEIGILKNDYIIIEKNNKARNGKVILGLIEDNEIILGRYFKNKDIIKIEFENYFCDPLTIENNKFTIIGEVKGHFGIIK